MLTGPNYADADDAGACVRACTPVRGPCWAQATLRRNGVFRTRNVNNDMVAPILATVAVTWENLFGVSAPQGEGPASGRRGAGVRLSTALQ